MKNIAKWLDNVLVDNLHISPDIAGFVNTAVLIAALTVVSVGINWLMQSIFRWIAKRSGKFSHSKWHKFLVKRKIGHHLILLITGFIFYSLTYIAFEKGTQIIRILHRIDIVYMLIVTIIIINALLMSFLDIYMASGKNRSRPLKSLVQGLQVILYFIGAIIIVAVIIDKSPTVLLTGLGASAAVLMLIFKDSILGFVAGVQLSQNDMIKLGDWIQMPDGSANGNVEEITLNTVKVRNWDNTISMIPPYTLVTTPFRNWRGMQESGGRRADKCIYLDVTTLEIYTPDMIEDMIKDIPALEAPVREKQAEGSSEISTNVGIYRLYIETYLRTHPYVNPGLDIIVTQKEATAYGLPIEVYFFTKEKTWAAYERQQSDIFDHLLTIVPEFGLKLYQRP